MKKAVTQPQPLYVIACRSVEEESSKSELQQFTKRGRTANTKRKSKNDSRIIRPPRGSSAYSLRFMSGWVSILRSSALSTSQ